MEDGVDADVLMDYVEFRIFPSQNRYESHICYGNKVEMSISGLLEQLVLHSPKIKSLHSKGSDANFRFKPLGNIIDAMWFTKSTLIRFLRIIGSSAIIDVIKATVNEISQLDEARKFHVSLYSKGPQDGVRSGKAGEGDYSRGAASLQQADDSPTSSDASKNELLRAMDLRLTALKGELAAAFDQAAGTKCSFEDIMNLEKFSYYFGAVELRNCLLKFIALSQDKWVGDFPDKEMSLTRDNVRSEKVGSEGSKSKTARPSESDTPVKYSASPAKAARMERQNSSGSEESSCTSEEEEQPSVERSRTLVRSASPRRSASPMRRVQIGRSGSRRSTALTIKSLNYFPTRERSISHKDEAASSSDERDSAQLSKKAETDVRRMSVQDAINLFESKQKGQTFDYQRTKSLLSASVGANKAVLRRWSSGVCESSKGSIDVTSDDPASMAANKLEDQDTDDNLITEPDSYPLDGNDGEAAAGDFKQSPDEEAFSPKASSTREEFLHNQGEEKGGKLNASIEWTRQKEAELQLLMKMMETKPTKYRNSATTGGKQQCRPTEHRGGFYDHYKEKRDEKLHGDTAKNKAEKDKQFKAHQQTLDDRKAEIVSANGNNAIKKPVIKRTQRTAKNSPESANTKDGNPKPAVAKKATSKASQPPATRKSWPSTLSPRVTGTSTAKTPPVTTSAGTAPTRRRSQPATAIPQSSQKVERFQPPTKPVKAPQNSIRKNATNVIDKKQQTLTKASKPTKAKPQPSSGDSASSAKPRISKVTKKSSVVPVESKEAKPFLRKGSGTGSGHSPVIKAKISSQPEKSLGDSLDFVQVEENDVASVASTPVNQPQDPGPEELKIHEDNDSRNQLSSPQDNEDGDICEADAVTADREDDFRRREEPMLTREVEDVSNISPSAWVEIEEQEDQPLPCNDGFGPNESLADVAAVRISSPRVRHSLSQMLREESSEDVIDWGNAENPPTMVYQKDVPKGLKRLLKFARKSKTDANSTGISSPSFFSEGEDDPEDSKLLTKSCSDNILRKATLHAKNSGQPKSSSEAFELSAQTSIGKIAAQKLQASRLSAPANATKASRSFFSLSAFKGSK